MLTKVAASATLVLAAVLVETAETLLEDVYVLKAGAAALVSVWILNHRILALEQDISAVQV